MKLSLSHWYPGSGVVLDCFDSLSDLFLTFTVNKNPLAMRGSRNFRQGGPGPGQSDKKKRSSDNAVFLFVFLVLSLFYRSQMVNFEEIYHFSRFQRGSNIFQGGPTSPPSGSALDSGIMDVSFRSGSALLVYWN